MPSFHTSSGVTRPVRRRSTLVKKSFASGVADEEVVDVSASGLSMSLSTVNENRSNEPSPEPWMRAYGVIQSILPPAPGHESPTVGSKKRKKLRKSIACG